MHRAKPGSDAKETNNVDTTITLDQRPRHVSGLSAYKPMADIYSSPITPPEKGHLIMKSETALIGPGADNYFLTACDKQLTRCCIGRLR